MFRRTILLLSAALAASVFLSYERVQAGKPVPPPPTGPRYLLHWLAGQEEGSEIEWSQPRGMNDNGDVVGLACWPAEEPNDPDHSGANWEVFVYTRATGVTENLNDVVATELAEDWPYWRLIDAGDINNSGEIVGTAEYRYEHYGWVWDDELDMDVWKLIVDQSFGVFRYVPTGAKAARHRDLWLRRWLLLGAGHFDQRLRRHAFAEELRFGRTSFRNTAQRSPDRNSRANRWHRSVESERDQQMALDRRQCEDR